MQNNPVPKIAIFIGAIIVTVAMVIFGYVQYTNSSMSASQATGNAISTLNDSSKYGNSPSLTVANGVSTPQPFIQNIEFLESATSPIIVINGADFGNAPSGVPGTVSGYVTLVDSSHGYGMGRTNDAVTANISLWSPSQIVVEPIGSYSSGLYPLNQGDSYVVTLNLGGEKITYSGNINYSQPSTTTAILSDALTEYSGSYVENDIFGQWIAGGPISCSTNGITLNSPLSGGTSLKFVDNQLSIAQQIDETFTFTTASSLSTSFDVEMDAGKTTSPYTAFTFRDNQMAIWDTTLGDISTKSITLQPNTTYTAVGTMGKNGNDTCSLYLGTSTTGTPLGTVSASTNVTAPFTSFWLENFDGPVNVSNYNVFLNP